ncbi:hypothetical protein STEG23_026589 [Scotinomys teguina]
MAVHRPLISMVKATPSEAVIGEATMSPSVGELCVGAPVPGATRRRAAPVLVSVRSAWLFCMKDTVKGNIVFIPFFHSVYFFSRDSMDVSST